MRFVAILLSVFGIVAQCLARKPLDPAGASESQIALSKPLSLLWQYVSDQTMDLTPAIDGDRIYLPLSSGSLVSLHAIDGTLSWKTDIGGELCASPAADERAVYIASQAAIVHPGEVRATGALRALGREAGITLWMRTLAAPIHGGLTLNGESLLGGSADGRVYSLAKKSGQLQWVTQSPSPISSPVVGANSRVFVGSEDGSLLALEELTGNIIWRYRTHGAVRARPIVQGGIVYVGSADGYVYAVNESNGLPRWRSRTGAAIQSVAASDGGLLVTSLDDFVYFLSFSRGNRLWKHQLDGRPISQPLTSVDSALFVPLSGDSGVVLALRDGKTLNNIPLGEDNSTGASPMVAGNLLLLTTRHGLLAFSQPHGLDH